MSLKNLHSILPVYFIPHDNFIGEVLIPCLKESNSFQCMLGFFSSTSMREIAPGLAEFLQKKENKMQLLISPFISADDQKALKQGVTTHHEVLEKRLIELFGEAYINESALIRHTLDCLAYLIAVDRLEIKITLISNALFHPKIWILSDGENAVVAHGSVNMTQRALTLNYEHITVELSWQDKNQLEKVERFSKEFKAIWSAKRQNTVVINLPEAIREKLLTDYQPDLSPIPSDFFEAWKKDHADEFVMQIPERLEEMNFSVEKTKFHIPSWIRFREGDFAHQGKAVDSWFNNNSHGILEMATGSGKTITSMIAAYYLYQKWPNLLIVIAVPYVPLVNQWEEETQRFGLKCFIPNRENSRTAKFSRIEHSLRSLQLGLSDIECMIITHDLLCDPEFQRILGGYSGNIMLIADEVHNLGRKQFTENPPNFPKFKLGLSATPIRQYDEIGTSTLLNYFGKVVYQFGLEEAIGNCLVPYEYFVHPVSLTTEELDEWAILTEKIKKSNWYNSNNENEPPSEYVASLLRRRRLVLENAMAKIDKLTDLLKLRNPKNYHHLLIYTTDKNPDQLIQVNKILRNFGIRFHQITARETTDPKLVTQIFKRFKNRELQVLTAKRVLDEGVNIPEVTTAFILASTTVERQWVQRRGRLLRKCPSIDKKFSVIHDFLTLPPENDFGNRSDVTNLIKSELRRVLEFAKLAKNAASHGGALDVITPIYSRYFAGERN